jgi:alkylglycerol monooxygenase
MEVYGKILSIVLPVYVFLFLIELYFDKKLNAHVIKGMDSISSMSSGMVNGVKDVLGLSVSIITYSWLYSKIAVTNIPDKWWVFVLAFFALEFQGYVVHSS